MADAKIIAVGPGEVELIADLYGRVFSPSRDEAYFTRRFHGRYNVSIFVALVENDHVGFAVGYELKPGTYYSWTCGVVPEARRMGVAAQLIQAQSAFAKENDYAILRFECQNQHRPMLHLAITEGFDLVGIRYDTESGANVVIFEKELI